MLFVTIYQAVQKAGIKLTITVTSIILTFVLVTIPLELLLRSDYSKLYLFGVYGSLPQNLVSSLRNSLGYRDVEHDLEKLEGMTRILILGDSLTYGAGVADNEIYPFLLAELAGPHVEIINMSVGGWNTRDELNALYRDGLALAPDIVVVGVVTNDPETPLPRSIRRGPKEWRFFTHIPSQIPLLRLDTFRFLDYQINRLGDRWGLKYGYSDWEADLYDPEGPYWPRWQQTVREFRELLRSHNILAYAFILPSPVDFKTAETKESFHTLLAQELTAAGFQTVDLQPIYTREFGAISYKKLWALPNDGHPGPVLHEFYAREIWKVLQPQIGTPTPELYLQLINSYTNVGRQDAALDAYHRLLELKPDLAQGKNLLNNGGFEEGVWNVYPISKAATFGLDPNVGYNGRYSALIEGLAEGQHGLWFQSVLLEPGVAYHFSAWIKTQNIDMLQVDLLQWEDRSTGIRGGSEKSLENRTLDWTYVETIIVAPSSSEIYLAPIVVYNEGKVWVDDVKLVRLS